MYKSAVIAAAVLSTGATASAKDGDWYASGQFGVRAVEREEATAPGVDIDVELSNGLYLSGAVGRAFGTKGPQLRLEGEVAWRGGKLNNFDINNVPVAVTGNGFSALSFMTNGYADFNNRSRFTPYIGAGVGVAQIKGDINAGANLLDDTATAFAIQGIGGVDIEVTENASLFADLRYFRAIGTTMTLTGSAGSGDVDVEYDAYTVGAGIRIRF
ncbi:MAG: OmpW family outer membrane protein [Pseudomonadota bacterium]